MMTHTSGPWEVGRTHSYNGEKGYYVQAANGKNITGWGSITATLDNATLISAAPDMFAVLEAYENLYKYNKNLSYEEWFKQAREVRRLTKVALDKVRGK